MWRGKELRRRYLLDPTYEHHCSAMQDMQSAIRTSHPAQDAYKRIYPVSEPICAETYEDVY